jgi:predicted phage terminase large subunit-like protein
VTFNQQIAESEYLALLEAEDYYLAEKSLSHFIKAAWLVLEPGRPYLHNWHIDAIAEHLEAVQLGQIRKLIINMPPRNLKSISVTVCFPCWVWIRDPKKRFFCASYAAQLSTKHSTDRRELMRSSWYQRAWQDRFSFAEDQDQKTLYKNNYRGQMYSTSVGGSGTGEGGDIIIIDDPMNPKMAASDVEREGANTWRDQTVSSRKNDKKTAAEIIVMQRLHEKDLTGHVLSKKDDPEPWTVLCLEGQATKAHTVIFPISGKEITREKGDLLHPEREGDREHRQARADLGSAGYQAQYQQDPRPIAGGFFKRSWWRFYKELPMQRIRRIQFWDCAEVPGVTNDFSVCATWDQTQSGFYLVHLWEEQVAFPELEMGAKNLYAQFKPDGIVIEHKSAGIQLYQNLSATTTLPVLKFDPSGISKVVRASGAQPTVESGNCVLPEGREFVENFIDQHEKFPNAEHDDKVDTTSMMVAYFRNPQAFARVRVL